MNSVSKMSKTHASFEHAKIEQVDNSNNIDFVYLKYLY